LIPALHLKGGIEWAMGDLTIASKTFRLAIDSYQYEKHHETFINYPYPFDPGISSIPLLASVYWLKGEFDHAEQLMIQADNLTQKDDVPAFQTHVYARHAYIGVISKDLNLATKYAEKVYKLSCKHGFELWLSISQVILGWVACQKGKLTEGLNDINEGLSAYLSTNAIGHASWLKSLKADALLQKNELENAILVIDEAIELAVQQDDSFYLPESYRIKHLILSSMNMDSEFLKKSYTLAKKQKANGYIERIIKNK
jgi:tetratricopeptide (TPR) repeat protein